MTYLDQSEHNDLISLPVRVANIHSSNTGRRAYRLSVETYNSKPISLTVWNKTQGMDVEWKIGSWYRLYDALVKQWENGVELNVTSKTRVEQMDRVPSDDAPESTEEANAQDALPVGSSKQRVPCDFVHVGSIYYGSSNVTTTRRREFQRALKQTIDVAIEEEVSAVVHTGELFGTRSPVLDDLSFLTKELERLKRHDISFVHCGSKRDHDMEFVRDHIYRGLIHRPTREAILVGETAFYCLPPSELMPAHAAAQKLQTPPPDATERVVCVPYSLAPIVPDADVSARKLAEQVPFSVDKILGSHKSAPAQYSDQVTDGLTAHVIGPAEYLLRKPVLETPPGYPCAIAIHRGGKTEHIALSYRSIRIYEIACSASAEMDDLTQRIEPGGMTTLIRLHGVETQSITKEDVKEWLGSNTEVYKVWDDREDSKPKLSTEHTTPVSVRTVFSAEDQNLSTDDREDHTSSRSQNGDTQQTADIAVGDLTQTGEVRCPANGCSYGGTLSRVIHHVTGEDDKAHTWKELGYQHSYEFRKEHTDTSDADRPGDSSKESCACQRSEEDLTETPLEDVAGIGKVRRETLQKRGYEHAADIATVSVEELSQTPKISTTIAVCIQETARNACGYRPTFISRLASRLNADPNRLAAAYEELAGSLVTPTKAKETLQLLVEGASDRSVIHLSSYSLRYRHFLIQEGFRDVQTVAEASISELTEAKYIGEGLAENLRGTARERVERLSGAPATETRPDASRSDWDESNPDGSESCADDAGESQRGGHEETEGSEALTAGDTSTSSDRFPAEMVSRDQWLLWKQTDDGQKIPRAPWATGEPLRFVSAMEPKNWTSFEDARRWMSTLPHDLEMAYALTRDDDVVFLDLDDVIVDGVLSDAAQRLIDDANSYAALSTSGTGIHIFLIGRLSEEVKSLTGPLGEAGEQTLEVYDRNRFIAMTGNHLEGTPTELAAGEGLLTRLEEEHGSVSKSTPDRATVEPQRSRDELEAIETTSDIQDVFDAINQTQPSDITMRSTKTREHADGTYSYDPSWVHSESGTRLGVLEDVWIYRKGMIVLNALQVVALEEGILTDERDYPEGKAFWDAVEALRERGAHIPQFEPDGMSIDDAELANDTEDDAPSKWDIAQRINYGEPVRTHIHPYDRDYQEQLALELAPLFVEATASLPLSPAVTHRAAALYAKGHAAGIVPGAAHESTVGGAIRLATIEAGVPVPLDDIAAVTGESTSSIRQKFHRLIQETDLVDTVDPSDLVVDPPEYIPYVATKLGYVDNKGLCDDVHSLLKEAELNGSSSPLSQVAACFYALIKNDPEYSITQEEIARAVGLSEATIRNNYPKFMR
jgi:predicted flap endonuclease-1-like 5' DNA nuclease